MRVTQGQCPMSGGRRVLPEDTRVHIYAHAQTHTHACMCTHTFMHIHMHSRPALGVRPAGRRARRAHS